MIVLFARTCYEGNLSVEWRDALHQQLLSAQRRLRPDQHAIDCPVHAGASADCCWPFEVCVPDEFRCLTLPINLVIREE
jgi:hypothetical protein